MVLWHYIRGQLRSISVLVKSKIAPKFEKNLTQHRIKMSFKTPLVTLTPLTDLEEAALRVRGNLSVHLFCGSSPRVSADDDEDA